jgi:hypothetical protein
MPGALLVRLRAGLRKKKRKKVRRSNGTRKITSKRQEVRRTGSLLGSDRHLRPVPLPAIGLAAAILLGALGGRLLAGAGVGSRSFVLLASEVQLVQELLANFGCQGSNILHDLRVRAV